MLSSFYKQNVECFGILKATAYSTKYIETNNKIEGERVPRIIIVKPDINGIKLDHIWVTIDEFVDKRDFWELFNLCQKYTVYIKFNAYIEDYRKYPDLLADNCVIKDQYCLTFINKIEIIEKREKRRREYKSYDNKKKFAGIVVSCKTGTTKKYGKVIDKMKK